MVQISSFVRWDAIANQLAKVSVYDVSGEYFHIHSYISAMNQESFNIFKSDDAYPILKAYADKGDTTSINSLLLEFLNEYEQSVMDLDL